MICFYCLFSDAGVVHIMFSMSTVNRGYDEANVLLMDAFDVIKFALS